MARVRNYAIFTTTGEPIEGAIAILYRHNDYSTVEGVTVTNKDGLWEFDVAPGRYDVTVIHMEKGSVLSVSRHLRLNVTQPEERDGSDPDSPCGTSLVPADPQS
jgi:hypothetical protein